MTESMNVAVLHHGIGMKMKTLRRSRASFHRFYFAIARRNICLQRMQQLSRNVRHTIDRPIKRFFIRLGRFGEAAQFPNELKRGCADLFLRGRRREVMQGFDVSTHKQFLILKLAAVYPSARTLKPP